MSLVRSAISFCDIRRHGSSQIFQLTLIAATSVLLYLCPIKMLPESILVASVVLASLALLIGLGLLCIDICRLWMIENKWLQVIQFTTSAVFCLCMVGVIVILAEWHQGKICRYSS